MDFNDTPREAAFRAQARTWLNTFAHPYAKPAGTESEADFIKRARAWQKIKAEAGYAAIRWSKDEGGLDGTPIEEIIFTDEEAKFSVPVGPFVTIGTQLAVPTIRSHGNASQINQFARATLYGDTLWCQLFSEPAAGSDLAGLRTRAVQDGGDWIVNGQKVWTSWAHVADWGILIARTDASVPKHKGLSYFLVDMRSPGIEIRRIRQISGESEFNEVFFTDVRIPDANRLGNVGDGWKVAMTTLMNERISVGGESQDLPQVADLLSKLDAAEPAIAAPYRLFVAQMLAQEQGLKYFRARQITALSRGETPGPIAALGKLVQANLMQELSRIALDVEGLSGHLTDHDDALVRKFQRGYFWSAALRIAGGTDEILRNQIAERVLSLPGDIRVDKEVPFSELK
ncbi:acyl-CoA dehydrogenase family protein [Burkholderia sp. R-69980]|nr:acyl-CoA dehydrogenase family protein [Burkholderia sp. R-69980]